MKRKIELLAPGGDVDSIKSAILAGADAVYCGLNKFNARNRAANISFENLQGITRLAHSHNCQVFLTLNIIVFDSEIPALIKLLNKLVNTAIDGVIVQDLGLFYLLSNFFKNLKIHASTQLTTHNKGQIQYLSKLNAERVNFSRELNINEIRALTQVAHQNHLKTEVFVHGSYCISFSGICYMSAVHGGNSGNRGQCSQPCRERYMTTPTGKNFPLNLKDNSAYFDVDELYEAGVDSLKIEGRIKEFEYVYTAVNTWRKQIDTIYEGKRLINDNSDLYKVFNRDFSNSFLKGAIGKDMFIDNPMSQSTIHHSEVNNYTSDSEILKGQTALYGEKEKLREYLDNEIAKFDIDKIPLKIKVSGVSGSPLVVSIETPEKSFDVHSVVNLKEDGTQAIDNDMLLKRLKAINETEFTIVKMQLAIDAELYLPFKELTSIKKRILFILNGSKEVVAPVTIPVLKRQNNKNAKPTLSVIISAYEDVDLCNDSSIDVYFKLPNSFKERIDELVDLFKKNSRLIPWFPAVLIEDDYTVAVQLLEQLRPKCIVTNNTGIAFEAYKNQINWIAGPNLNISNSYSLLCLKESFNCKGSFLSNEMGKVQMKGIRKPDDFNLYYTIYNPIVLMTSRQCLFHQVVGCEKSKIDNACIQQCEKASSIENLKNETFIIEKTKGNYHNVYDACMHLNTDIIVDFPTQFSRLFIDLSDVNTDTKIDVDKTKLIELFKNHINGDLDSTLQLNQIINPSNNTIYKKGV